MVTNEEMNMPFRKFFMKKKSFEILLIKCFVSLFPINIAITAV